MEMWPNFGQPVTRWFHLYKLENCMESTPKGKNPPWKSLYKNLEEKSKGLCAMKQMLSWKRFRTTLYIDPVLKRFRHSKRYIYSQNCKENTLTRDSVKALMGKIARKIFESLKMSICTVFIENLLKAMGHWYQFLLKATWKCRFFPQKQPNDMIFSSNQL